MDIQGNILLLILLALSHVLADVDGHLSVYYIKVDNNSSCPDDPCATLNKYAENVSAYFASDTQMVFLPGVHILKANSSIHVSNVSQLSLIASIGNLNYITQPSTIQCEINAGFSFVNTTHLEIHNLIFSNCGQPVSFASASMHAALAFHSVFYLTISEVTVQNSSGYGMYAVNVLGISSSIIRSTFQFNTGSTTYNGGNIAIFYKDCSIHHAHIYFEDSDILYGFNDCPIEPRHDFYPVATGISLWTGCSNVAVSINRTRMFGNIASGKSSGGNLAIVYFNMTSIIQNCVYVNNSLIVNGTGTVGGGLFVLIDEMPISINSSNPGKESTPEFLCIENTLFIGNYASEGGGLYIDLHEPVAFSHRPGLIVVSNCTFMNNAVTTHRDAGVAVHIINHYSLGLIEHHQIQFSVLFSQCIFSSNILKTKKDPNSPNSGSGVVFITQYPSNTSFHDCTFENNSATAIAAVNSYLIFSGTITIQNNTGIDGGGIVLCDRSYMFLTPYTHILIANNHAQHSGGGIYAEHQCLQSEPLCFFEFVDVNRTTLETIHIELINNTAGYAGSALYGGSVDYCYVPNIGLPGKQLFKTIFNFEHSPTDLSYISSDPLHVCFCNSGTRDCNIHTTEVLKFPGEMFQIAAVAVGQMQGTVPGVVVANPTETSEVISDSQVSQWVKNNCTLLNYTVFSNSSFETLSLTVQRPYLNQGTQYETWLKVFLKVCPLGFSLRNERPHFCDCNPVLKRHGIVCYINNQTIYRPNPNWIGYDHASGGILFHKVCPYDYCNMSLVYITASDNSFNQDEQCAFNRTGILCGACPEGLSVVLGSSRCLTCSNFYLVLLIPFALAGLLLVFFLTVCNLTVSVGTINGLILYANIVQANNTILSYDDINLFAVFIAWLNLDLGIETCFYDGMDEYAKTWLQFAFPVYIWLISALIIFLSRRYNFAARLVGKNAVNVLATLFLLSFGKQIHTIISAFSFTVISYPNGSEVHVWLPDGNLQYLKTKHLLLFVAACIFTALILPYVIVLLLIQCLQRLNVRVLSWIGKLKPFFDAYTGPYKDKCRFWVGFLLLVRILPFTVNGANIVEKRILNLLQLITSGTLLVTALAWSFHGVYKKWPLNALEASFILNLGMFAIAAVSFQNNRRMQEISTGISVGIAFATFIGILVYHTYMKLRNTQWCNNLSIWLQLAWLRYKPTAQTREATCRMECPVNPDQQLPPFVRFDEDREPLLALEDTD